MMAAAQKGPAMRERMVKLRYGVNMDLVFSDGFIMLFFCQQQEEKLIYKKKKEYYKNEDGERRRGLEEKESGNGTVADAV